MRSVIAELNISIIELVVFVGVVLVAEIDTTSLIEARSESQTG